MNKPPILSAPEETSSNQEKSNLEIIENATGNRVDSVIGLGTFFEDAIQNRRENPIPSLTYYTVEDLAPEDDERLPETATTKENQIFHVITPSAIPSNHPEIKKLLAAAKAEWALIGMQERLGVNNEWKEDMVILIPNSFEGIENGIVYDIFNRILDANLVENAISWIGIILREKDVKQFTIIPAILGEISLHIENRTEEEKKEDALKEAGLKLIENIEKSITPDFIDTVEYHLICGSIAEFFFLDNETAIEHYEKASTLDREKSIFLLAEATINGGDIQKGMDFLKEGWNTYRNIDCLEALCEYELENPLLRVDGIHHYNILKQLQELGMNGRNLDPLSFLFFNSLSFEDIHIIRNDLIKELRELETTKGKLFLLSDRKYRTRVKLICWEVISKKDFWIQYNPHEYFLAQDTLVDALMVRESIIPYSDYILQTLQKDPQGDLLFSIIQEAIPREFELYFESESSEEEDNDAFIENSARNILQADWIDVKTILWDFLFDRFAGIATYAIEIGDIDFYKNLEKIGELLQHENIYIIAKSWQEKLLAKKQILDSLPQYLQTHFTHFKKSVSEAFQDPDIRYIGSAKNQIDLMDEETFVKNSALIALDNIFLDSDTKSHAREAFKILESFDVFSPEDWSLFGYILYAIGDVEDAIPFLQNACQKDFYAGLLLIECLYVHGVSKEDWKSMYHNGKNFDSFKKSIATLILSSKPRECGKFYATLGYLAELQNKFPNRIKNRENPQSYFKEAKRCGYKPKEAKKVLDAINKDYQEYSKTFNVHGLSEENINWLIRFAEREDISHLNDENFNHLQSLFDKEYSMTQDYTSKKESIHFLRINYIECISVVSEDGILDFIGNFQEMLLENPDWAEEFLHSIATNDADFDVITGNENEETINDPVICLFSNKIFHRIYDLFRVEDLKKDRFFAIFSIMADIYENGFHSKELANTCRNLLSDWGDTHLSSADKIQQHMININSQVHTTLH